MTSFSERHIGPRPHEVESMLTAVDAPGLDSLMDETLPSHIRLARPLDLPGAQSEEEYLKELKKTLSKNRVKKCYMGMGYYPTYTPAVILRNILENPGWYTQYTPYQAEISQGRLEALLNFQTLVMELTDMEVANASLLDEGTSAAEAMTLAWNLAQRQRDKKESRKFFVAGDTFPQTIDVLKTRAEPLGIEVVTGDPETAQFDADTFGGLIQYPRGDGAVEDCSAFCEALHAVKAVAVVATDLLALTLLKPPGSLGADIVVGNSQRFGVPMGFGGPHAAFFATRDAYKRQVPGRIIGVSRDRRERTALRMALQTREQHIRREKATSNICTAQVLLAIMASMYAVYHGPEGLAQIARRVHALTASLAHALKKAGMEVIHSRFFDTLRIRVGAGEVEAVKQRCEQSGILLRYFPDRETVGLSLDETTTLEDVAQLARALTNGKARVENTGGEDAATHNATAHLKTEAKATVNPDRDPENSAVGALARAKPFLEHPVFNSYQSETEMLRYIKKLERKDLSLTQSMIPLGSCTMKLNATSEMIPVTWPEVGNMHPFAPEEDTRGYRELFTSLENHLKIITGLPGVSLQPNAGSQGEYAGLLMIREYHKDQGAPDRATILIPSSAHGTNPASAALAGMQIVIVACDSRGNIDIQDLKQKAEQHRETLAGLMVTYPSTHGVFEDGIQTICEIIHEHGGLVYMDGANMNAQVGLCHPASIGADVCHLNLHKTFCIPHGGGGPGMGPICVVEKLIPYLPGHFTLKYHPKAIKAVAAAPWGSPSILPISHAYIAMMGEAGLRRSTEVAILNANYMVQKLKDSYPVLYTGENDRVAHEFIIDFRPFKASTKIDAIDVAKRLMDYGFHAPTVSFPVPGTMMIEPTESESQGELDRYCEALINIRGEIQKVADGEWDPEDNPLKNAPHTQEDLAQAEWIHPYTREEAVFPLAWVKDNKYWPPVSRIDDTYGDKNLMCACPPVEEYGEPVRAG